MSVGIAFFLLIIGLMNLIFPYASWFLYIGWKIRNAEPSDAYLLFSRIVGGIVSAVAIIVIVVAFVQTGQQQAHAMDGWNMFQKEMTVNNISSIEEENNSKVKATPKQIQEFVHDIQGLSATQYGTKNGGGGRTGGAFYAQNSFLITCADGYHVVLINEDNNGNFGIAGPAWLAPDYEFTSDTLNEWVRQVTPQ
ncbi:hypothetical protein O9H85_21600 [Paenibacillus filicis]|uniref:DUF6199 domain-containing protein n=1 Tax=Paenibacillus gyeongsangnamensis TaxID=3388067 RepID=A0ABT4QDL8_9BACL|nr:DUF6199 family natural product biosynthesis protein [Paenibacillus filicis]MCZ8514969.1 hypothetical protein [Paenibacillus filicis]